MHVTPTMVTIVVGTFTIGAIMIGAAWRLAREIGELKTEMRVGMARLDERVAAIEPMRKRVPTEPPGVF